MPIIKFKVFWRDTLAISTYASEMFCTYFYIYFLYFKNLASYLKNWGSSRLLKMCTKRSLVKNLMFLKLWWYYPVSGTLGSQFKIWITPWKIYKIQNGPVVLFLVPRRHTSKMKTWRFLSDITSCARVGFFVRNFKFWYEWRISMTSTC